MKFNRKQSSLALVILAAGLIPTITARVLPADNSGTSALYAVNAFASDNVWAAGYKYQGNLSFPLVEHWDGISWTIVSNPSGVAQSHGRPGLHSALGRSKFAISPPRQPQPLCLALVRGGDCG